LKCEPHHNIRNLSGFESIRCLHANRCPFAAGVASQSKINNDQEGTDMLKEFREFAMRGNVVDLAVGIIIGAAFTSIVTSLVNDILMPPIGLLLAGINFKDLFISLNRQPYPSLEAAQAAGAPIIAYGQFINAVINFIIVAFVVFLIVRAINRMKSRQEGAPEDAPTTKPCPYCLSTIPLKATRCPSCTSELAGRPAPAD
jgi:large conductance mechanosensitive channel